RVDGKWQTAPAFDLFEGVAAREEESHLAALRGQGAEARGRSDAGTLGGSGSCVDVDLLLAAVAGDRLGGIRERPADAAAGELRMHLNLDPRGVHGVALAPRLVDGPADDAAIDASTEQPPGLVRRLLPPGQEFGRGVGEFAAADDG